MCCVESRRLLPRADSLCIPRYLRGRRTQCLGGIVQYDKIIRDDVKNKPIALARLLVAIISTFFWYFKRSI